MKQKLHTLIAFLLIQTAVFAQQGTHLNFDGVNDNVVLPANIGNTLSGGTEITIEYWFKGTNIQSAFRIQNASGWIVAGWGNPSNPLFIVSTDGGTIGVSCGSIVNDNTWHHLAFVWKKNTIFATYLDGVLQNSRVAANVNLPIFSGTTAFIGSFNGSSEFMNGNIDEVRIWNVAKTPTQINAAKNCELQGDEAGLVAYYKFNQGINAGDNTAITLTDATTNPNNGTLTNFTLTGTTSNWLAGSPVTTGSIVPSNATVTTPVVYTQGATATALTATTGANGTGLLWYTTATGGTGTTTAPTPSTVNPSSTSYWVSSTNANGCESARVEIVVQVNASTTAGCWAKIAAGDFHTIAIAQNGTLWSWGDNYSGQLGQGDYAYRTTPVQVGTDTNWQTVTAGSNHTLATKTTGTLWAWGGNYYFQLGLGDIIGGRNTPVQVGTDSNWQSVSGGSYYTLATKTTGTLWAWGDNANGQLGLGDIIGYSNNPVQVGTDTNWQSVNAGTYHTLATKTTGTLWVWGNNYYGQLGLGDTANRNTPVQVGTATDWQSVTAGGLHTLATKTTGTLWSWGNNDYGQLGLGDIIVRNTPVQVGTDTNWQTVTAGSNHTLATKTTGTLWAWGVNYYGNLGLGDTGHKNIPIQVGTDTNWQTVTCGSDNSIATKTTGTLWAWGYNFNGQLGLGDTTDRNVPIEVTCPAVLSSDEFITENNVTIYPNPSNGIFTIDVKEAVTVEVYDMIGKKVFNSKIALGSSNLDLSNHANGIYLLMVTNQNGSATTYKLIKQ